MPKIWYLKGQEKEKEEGKEKLKGIIIEDLNWQKIELLWTIDSG